MVWGLNASRGKRFFSSPKHPEWLWGLPSCIFKAIQGPSPEVKDWGTMLNTHLHLTPRLRMSGSTPLLTLHAFIS